MPPKKSLPDPPAARNDSDRLWFLSYFKISVTQDENGVSLFWRGPTRPGQPGPYYPITQADTLEAAIDAAITRWEKKHRRHFGPDEIRP